MFTGLVEKVGEFVNVRQRGNGAELTVKHDGWSEPLVLGESVAVQGVGDGCFRYGWHRQHRSLDPRTRCSRR